MGGRACPAGRVAVIIRCDKCSELKNQNKSSHHQGMQFVLRESRNISQLERIDCANKFCRMLCVTGTRYRPQASSWASAASLVRGCDPLPWLPISALENLRTMYGLCVVVGIVLSVRRLLPEPNNKVACWLLLQDAAQQLITEGIGLFNKRKLSLAAEKLGLARCAAALPRIPVVVVLCVTCACCRPRRDAAVSAGNRLLQARALGNLANVHAMQVHHGVAVICPRSSAAWCSHFAGCSSTILPL